MEMATLNFSDLVRTDCIIDSLDVQTRDEALTAMSEHLVANGYCRETFPAAILERERIHPSGLPMAGHKIAIPHTDAEHVLSSTILFARLRRPVKFYSMGSPDETLDIQMISMFALREKKQIGDMLETLINVYQHDEILDALLHAHGADAMFEILQRAVEQFGV